jgi:hypothetical protein
VASRISDVSTATRISSKRARENFDPDVRQLEQRSDHAVVFTEITEATMARGALLWLLGVPIPIIILLLLFWR